MAPCRIVKGRKKYNLKKGLIVTIIIIIKIMIKLTETSVAHFIFGENVKSLYNDKTPNYR